MGFIRIFNKIVKWVLISIASFVSLIFIFITTMILEYAGFIEINIKNKTDYLVLWEWWWNQDCNCESVIDFAEIMPFEWDYFVKYSKPDNLEDIKKEYNIETDDMYDISGHELRVMFIRNNKVVFYEDWSWEGHPYVYPKGAALFADKYLVVKKEDAKFRAKKEMYDDEDYTLWLRRIE